ncbi:hypothetical protein JOB18_007333 [Solea senegalensis]|uniref:Uncharacterized protein n=1 Tax=Solea senegalensis TaxID=28829 RepID=A0AAV6SJ49_SOLSE|nr:hypothetical protein JOB18_007333 [Solea senegalensis]
MDRRPHTRVSCDRGDEVPRGRGGFLGALPILQTLQTLQTLQIQLLSSILTLLTALTNDDERAAAGETAVKSSAARSDWLL